MADSSEQIGQDEIEQLLRQAQGGKASQPPAAPDGAASAPAATGLGQDEIESLLKAGAARPASSPAPQAPPQSAKLAAAEIGLDQGEIEALLNKATGAATAKPPPAATAPRTAASSRAMPVSDVELLLHHAQEALASVTADAEPLPSGVRPFKLEDFTGSPPSSEVATLELLRDVELDLKIELGRTHMYLEDVLRLRKGSVVPLDKLAGDPVDIYVNGRLIARGEVLVLNDNFCVRVAELIAADRVGAA